MVGYASMQKLILDKCMARNAGEIKFRVLPSVMISRVGYSTPGNSLQKTAVHTDPSPIARPFRRQPADEQREVWNGVRQ